MSQSSSIGRERPTIAFVHGVTAGAGGLGIQAANVAAGLAIGGTDLHAFGPGHINCWPLSEWGDGIHWHESPSNPPLWLTQYTWRRWQQGQTQFEHDTKLGQWAADKVAEVHPQLCYVFTQVGLEVLKWAKQNGIPTVLESPNGHIRNFRSVYQQESVRWCGSRFGGHPTIQMVERVEEEYELADRIRVSSNWAKTSLVNGGVPATKVHVLQQPIDLDRFHPLETQGQFDGPLRVCFVGSLDLRKGFVYLLQALKHVPPESFTLEIVGATGSRCCARLFESLGRGLTMKVGVGDPLAAYHRAEIFVLPTLEDGSPFAVAEAMACGLPAVVTDSCGSAEWVEHDRSGWILPSGQFEPLADVLVAALDQRNELGAMGVRARLDTENRAGPSCFTSLRAWL